jgi:hypothetical protein
MASLTGQKIKDTYQSLLKTADNGLVTNAFKGITDGSGSTSGLYLKNDGVLLSGSVNVSGSLNVNGINIEGNIDTGSLATTGSNTFNGDQTIIGIVSSQIFMNTQIITENITIPAGYNDFRV